ncbi:hypothetical protein, partial [Methylobacterium frigidaeris]|uniref:hypothetical protein n=1 Tax=Methylobacterium frigidaeris TaxID=2038277 RepID=UPI001A9C5CF6
EWVGGKRCHLIAHEGNEPVALGDVTGAWSAPIGVVHRRVWWIWECEGERLVDAGADSQIRA